MSEDGEEKASGRFARAREMRDVLHRRRHHDDGSPATIEEDTDAPGHGDAALVPADSLDAMARDALRAELHAAVDARLEAYASGPHDLDALQTGLHAEIDKVLNHQPAPEALRHQLMSTTPDSPARADDVPDTVNGALDMLKVRLAAVFAGSRKRIVHGAASVAKAAPAAVPLLQNTFARFLDDPKRLKELQKGIEVLLSRYMSPTRAKMLAGLALSLATAAAKKKREPGS